MAAQFLLDHFAALDNSRQSWMAIFPLLEVHLIVSGGWLAGAENGVDSDDDEDRWRSDQASLERRQIDRVADGPPIGRIRRCV